MLGSRRSVSLCCCEILLRNATYKGLCSLFTSCILCSFPSHNSWPCCGESQHRQDSIFPCRAVLCSEIWKVVFWVWSGDRRRHACWLGQARLSAWHWAGGWWPSLCVWRQQGESGSCPHVPRVFSKHFPGSWKYWVSESLASKWVTTTTGYSRSLNDHYLVIVTLLFALIKGRTVCPSPFCNFHVCPCTRAHCLYSEEGSQNTPQLVCEEILALCPQRSSVCCHSCLGVGRLATFSDEPM